jgi:hypothetical protein
MESQALRYKVESRFTDAVMRELVHRGRGLRVQGQREGADAVIEGVIRSFNFGGVLLDDKGRARIFEVTIVAAVTVRDQTENRVLYDNQNFVFRGEYEFASDPRSFFNEEDPAVLRMARSFAESIVSTLINAVELKKLKLLLAPNSIVLFAKACGRCTCCLVPRPTYAASPHKRSRKLHSVAPCCVSSTNLRSLC